MHLRHARPTDMLEAVADLYRRGLGLQVVGEFLGHDGYDGIILGASGLGWEIEFTREEGETAGRAPSPEHLVVVYEADPDRWLHRCEAMSEAGFATVGSANPYWDERGRTFEDPEGYRVVVQNDTAPGQRAAAGEDPA